MDDLLDSAQKAINDAASAATPPAPPEPAPEPVVPEKPVEPPPTPMPAAETSSVVDTLLAPPATPPSPASPQTPSQGGPPKKKRPKSAIIAALFLFFITIPLTVFYVSQQHQLADIRSSAAPPPIENCSGCAGDGTAWKVVRGECKKVEDKSCKPDNPPPGQDKCGPSSAGKCQGEYPGTPCGDGGQCVMTDTGDAKQCSCQGQNKPTPIPTSQPTATPTHAPRCTNIKIYKDNAVVDPATLHAGDAVVLAVKGTGATKGRIRVNGGTFTETATKNANNEYTIDFTIPASITNFTVEAEVFISGAWR